MGNGGDYKIKKIEKGPLQRFKNQNLLIKKFGEVGLQVYKAITGKRTTQELRKDLGIEQQLFDQIVNYMQDAGMVELQLSGEAKAAPEAKPEAEGPAPEEGIEEEKPARPLEEIPPEEGEEEGEPPLEEKPQERAKAREEEEIRPEEGMGPVEEEKAPKPAAKKPAPREMPKAEEEEIAPEEEIKPIEEEAPPEEEKQVEEEKPAEEEAPPEEEEIKPKEEEEVSLAPYEEEKGAGPEAELSPVEKIISDKYGDIGLRVYALIDGQRTAEEIMRDTGLTEAKLVEILDFMDEQGIIKLDYPRGAAPPPQSFEVQRQAGPAPSAAQPKKEEGFVPLTEREEQLDEARAVPSPVEMPIKAPLDLVKSVQLKAKLMLKYGDKGSRVMESVDGKNDAIDISLRLGQPLYEVYDVLKFMMENGMIIMKPLTRTDVRKKYGDDGYSVYKKYGKEGLMLYELIGKELTIKQMAEKVTRDKSKVVDMFVFIHQVLGIELPIDKDVLAKQLGI